jgi:hypothetical protein
MAGKKSAFTKNRAPANRMFSSKATSERNSESLLLFWVHGTEFRVVFSFAELFGTEFQVFSSIFVPRNGIPISFLFRGMVQNEIPRVCFYFCSMVQIPSIFLLCVTVRNGILRVFCSVEQPEFCRNQKNVSSIPSSAE